ncbi:hypothetical protein ZOSMA_77G00940 [Zostera marina]|uniref:DUF7866 domain-containing protein n=1 Tax=Zostera marina TaxID=29655 RepID=A0A0K9NQR3_ZOSMR|nr:hypothetical protein ZOSMA_77G00940 [Zostera marina]
MSPLFFCIFLLLLRPTVSATIQKEAERDGSSEMMTPVEESKGLEPTKSMSLMVEEHRRNLRNFQICSVCTCCGGPRGLCLASPCCYAISCNIPNRPFGFCSFVPKKCNCFGCHI